MKNKYREPNYKNVKKGDFLLATYQGEIYSIPISEVKELSIITEEYSLSENSSFRQICPYEKAIIKKKSGKLLIGKDAGDLEKKFAISYKKD